MQTLAWLAIGPARDQTWRAPDGARYRVISPGPLNVLVEQIGTDRLYSQPRNRFVGDWADLDLEEG